ncbi:radial spoke head 1 homolog [Pollicipes pollicipes]|uniref:radial spoke head 1 homolog n=1 Tax=Pollicipes pollicipes TaxID=41117 RepID=UPI00188545EC|nr:radial spoke head 1 homolog [Pollicipes pollicipes]
MSDTSEEEEEQNTIGEYNGDRNEAKQRHGYGVAHLPNGDIYRGYYNEGKRHGRGHYRFKKNGSRYTGEWQDGKKHGRGVFVYPDGTRYEGNWEDDMKSGQGTYYFANGNKYVGEWREDMRQGMGICFCPASNCKYVGEWENDRRNGKGTLVHEDHRFDGLWKDDLPNGPGCYVFGDELVQEGVYIVREQELSDEEMGHSVDEDEPSLNLVPIWRAERVLCGEAAVNRIQHGLGGLGEGRQPRPATRAETTKSELAGDAEEEAEEEEQEQ